MRRVLNVINASISANAAMLLRIFGILIWIMYGICGFLFVRKCDTALVGVAGLDYPAVLKTAEALEYEVTHYDFTGLQVLEMDFLCEQAEKSSTNKVSK